MAHMHYSRGLISFVSDAYADSTTDRQICERSDLMNKSLFSSGDSIMADRGFNVQDLFAVKDMHVNIPSFLKGKSQLTAAEVVKDRRIAAKRIHIERVISDGILSRHRLTPVSTLLITTYDYTILSNLQIM